MPLDNARNGFGKKIWIEWNSTNIPFCHVHFLYGQSPSIIILGQKHEDIGGKDCVAIGKKKNRKDPLRSHGQDTKQMQN